MTSPGADAGVVVPLQQPEKVGVADGKEEEEEEGERRAESERGARHFPIDVCARPEASIIDEKTTMEQGDGERQGERDYVGFGGVIVSCRNPVLEIGLSSSALTLITLPVPRMGMLKSTALGWICVFNGSQNFGWMRSSLSSFFTHPALTELPLLVVERELGESWMGKERGLP